MKKAMKKITYLLIAAITLVCVASCVKEQMETLGPDASFGTEITVALAPGTRTDLLEGKTVWAEGDQLWVSNGAAVDTIDVPEAAFGLSEFSFKTVNATPTEANPDVFVVYPATAASKIADGKVVVNVPGVQDGTFLAANICAGQSKEGVVALKNVTGILMVSAAAELAAPLYQLVFNAVGETPLAGKCTVDLSGDAPVVTVSDGVPSVIVQAGGFEGPFYAAVIPGTYEAGFKMTAATVDFEHASETKVSTVANTVEINQIVDLGAIGGNLQPLSGEGTEASPWLIESLGHLIALGTAVDNGEESQKFEGKYFKVANDIDGVGTSIGTEAHPFCGDLDGNGKTISLNIIATTNGVGLFGELSNGANIHDLVLAGKIEATSDWVGALVGSVDCEADGARVTIQNVVNNATIKARNCVGGIAGYADNTDFENCTNIAAIEGERGVGGIIGYAYQSKLTSCTNTDTVTGMKECGGIYQNKTTTWNSGYWYNWETKAQTNINASTYGVGGIAGYAQNTAFSMARNEGKVVGVTKVGGIVGGSYACSTTSCVNAGSGSVEASSKFAGGIVGWAYTKHDCTGDSNQGSVTAGSVVGGIVGFLNAIGFSDSNAVSTITETVNTGAVSSTAKFSMQVASDTQSDYSMAGGIIGLMAHNSAIANNASSRRGIIHIVKCTNSGDVTGVGHGVGGLVGLAWSWFQYSTMSTIEDSSNTGRVEGYCRTGGILGEQFDRWIGHGTLTLRNLVNSGDVSVTIPTGTSSVGGIIGRSHYHSTSTVITAGAYGTKIYNCLNTGNVYYAADDNDKPYAGGIGGYFGRGLIENCVNSGFVGPVSKNKPVAFTHLGGITGQLGTTYCPVKYSYWDSTVADVANGTTSKDNTVTSALAYDKANGQQLSEIVTIGEVDYNIAADALNAWAVANSTETIFYCGWITGAQGPEMNAE